MSLLRPLARSLLCQQNSSLLCRFAALQICQLKTLAPKKPKAPLTPYFLFKEKNYEQVKASNPGLPMVELSKKLGAMYRELPQKDREVYMKQYREDKIKYQAELSKFMAGLSEEDKAEMKEDQKTIREERKMRKKSKLQREYGMPKRPAAAFGLFLQSKLPERENIPVTEYMKSVAAVWRRMPEQDKQPFRDQAAKEREIYQEEMKSWTKKMKRSGHSDLVENKTQKEELRAEIKRVKRRYLKQENAVKKELATLKKDRKKEVGELQRKLDLLK